MSRGIGSNITEQYVRYLKGIKGNAAEISAPLMPFTVDRLKTTCKSVAQAVTGKNGIDALFQFLLNGIRAEQHGDLLL